MKTHSSSWKAFAAKCALRVLWACCPLACLVTTPASGQTFPPSALDPAFPTYGLFKVVLFSGFEMTSPLLMDPGTVVGRSDPFAEGGEPPIGVPISNGGAAPYPNTASLGPDPIRLPVGWPETPGTRREVHTEILSMNLAGGGFSVLAGQPFFASVSAAGRSPLYRNSFGEVASMDPSGNVANDFPAHSAFNVFVEVQVPGMGNFYNFTPMVVGTAQTTITRFPPDFTLPTGNYIHDPSFPAVPLYNQYCVQVGYLTSAGHGGSGIQNIVAQCPDAPRFILPGTTVTFSVDAGSQALPSAVSPVNRVRDDAGNPAQQVTVYAATPNLPVDPPGNQRVPQLTGGVGGLPQFAAGDKITGISFGRDGTVDPSGQSRAGVLYFSVDRSSRGQEGTDVRLAATAISPLTGAPLPRQAGAIFVAQVPKFGAYAAPVTASVPKGNFLVLDPTALGLRPVCTSTDQDELSGFELSAFRPGVDRWYGTFTGPSFAGPGERATIWESAGAPLDRASLSAFALPTDMGLMAGDELGDIVLSDVSPGGIVAPDGLLESSLDEVLFSLKPGSPSLAAHGWSAADVLYSKFDGSCTVFATADDLGLLVTDRLGCGLDIACIPEPTIVALVGIGGLALLCRRRMKRGRS